MKLTLEFPHRYRADLAVNAQPTVELQFGAPMWASGFGNVFSVNGQSGVVQLDAADVGAIDENDPRMYDARPPMAHTHPASDIADSTALGRTILTAADAVAARAALGVGESDSYTAPVGANALSGHRVVAYDAGGSLIYADCTDQDQIGRIPGIITNAYQPGEQAEIITEGIVAHNGWSFSQAPVYVGASGALVQTLPPGAVFAQAIGFAVAPTRLHITLFPPFKLS